MIDRLALSALRALPPETAHRLGLKAARAGLAPAPPVAPDAGLALTLWGLSFPHPVGVAAGFDKNAEAPDALLRLGASFAEIGAVTPKPQSGNPRPRVFRLTEDRAVVNRMGFNNAGMMVVRRRLAARRPSPNAIVGVNLGANKDAPDRAADYRTVLVGLWGLAQFYTVNVSSPNTERLRDLQGKEALTELLGGVIETRNALSAESGTWAPILVKIAPDLTESELNDVAAAARIAEIDGIVATNTTVARAATLKSPHAQEKGGLSGAPLFEASTRALRLLAEAAGPAIPLIGVGGVSDAATAYAKIRAGASLVQLYTALVYGGPRVLHEIVAGLPALLRADGFDRLEDAIGADLRGPDGRRRPAAAPR